MLPQGSSELLALAAGIGYNGPDPWKERMKIVDNLIAERQICPRIA
jgi:hypothetical protein